MRAKTLRMGTGCLLHFASFLQAVAVGDGGKVAEDILCAVLWPNEAEAAVVPTCSGPVHEPSAAATAAAALFRGK